MCGDPSVHDMLGLVVLQYAIVAAWKNLATEEWDEPRIFIEMFVPSSQAGPSTEPVKSHAPTIAH